MSIGFSTHTQIIDCFQPHITHFITTSDTACRGEQTYHQIHLYSQQKNYLHPLGPMDFEMNTMTCVVSVGLSECLVCHVILHNTEMIKIVFFFLTVQILNIAQNI